LVLRFRYKTVERPQPYGVRALPVVPVTYLGRNGEAFESAALLDSGADYSIIFVEHAEILGVDLSSCEKTDCQGVGGKVKAWKTKVQVRLKGKGEHRSFTFELPVMVIERQASNFPLLLGREGFFEHFEITFNEKARWLSLKPLAVQ